MPVEATILIPTFDHGPTLRRSIPTALAQTVADIEVFVVGDGVPDVTREIVAEFMAQDPRVRFFDHPKGPRNGEAYRHALLGEARGKIVCYLSDDDLHFPDHVEIVIELLRDADFAHTLPAWIDPAGVPRLFAIDLSLESHRRQILEGSNRIPLPCAAHTMELYRRLPFGWRTTPDGIPTDHHMWKQILGVPGVRAKSGFVPTLVHMPSARRRGVPIDARLQEIDRWVVRMREPGFRQWFLAALVADSAESLLRMESELAAERTALALLRRSPAARALSRWPWLDRAVRRTIGRPMPDGTKA